MSSVLASRKCRASAGTRSRPQHLQSAFAEDGFAFLGAVFQEREDQLLLAHAVAPSISFDVAISSSWLTCCVLSSDKCIKRPRGMNDLRPFERKTGTETGRICAWIQPVAGAGGRAAKRAPAFCVKNRDFRCCCQEMR